MDKVTVFELAKRYGLTNEQMLSYLLNNGIEVNDYTSSVDFNALSLIIERLEGKTNLNEHINRSSLQRLKIEGLFDKYNYDIDFKNDIIIWVSENGKGKTTILNIIVALLKGDRKTLAGINFKKIEIQIKDKWHVIEKSALDKPDVNDRQLRHFFREVEDLLPPAAFENIQYEYQKYGRVNLNRLERMLQRHVMGEQDYHMLEKEWYYVLRKIREMQSRDFSETLLEIKSNVIEEPLFYPTYRRIEVSLDKIFLNNTSRNNEMVQYINFGMEDVRKRINGLLKKMSSDALESYAVMNGEIINDLLRASSIAELTQNIPNIDRHKVEVVLKRVGEERIENLDKLNAFVCNNEESPNEEFLKFYLDKLVKIYDSQKAIDDKLSRFATVCTKYLSGKKIIYDEALLLLYVQDEDGMSIDYEDLSSGEKQIVSIFSKVYLDITTSCILVTSEPEISLSITWQKEFLIDIYNSGKVALLIVSTHSPFIFKNQFRDYAIEMDVFREE